MSNDDVVVTQLMWSPTVEVETLHRPTPGLSESIAANGLTVGISEEEPALAELERSHMLAQHLDEERGQRDCSNTGGGLGRTEVGHSPDCDHLPVDPENFRDPFDSIIRDAECFGWPQPGSCHNHHKRVRAAGVGAEDSGPPAGEDLRPWSTPRQWPKLTCSSR